MLVLNNESLSHKLLSQYNGLLIALALVCGLDSDDKTKII